MDDSKSVELGNIHHDRSVLGFRFVGVAADCSSIVVCLARCAAGLSTRNWNRAFKLGNRWFGGSDRFNPLLDAA